MLISRRLAVVMMAAIRLIIGLYAPQIKTKFSLFQPFLVLESKAQKPSPFLVTHLCLSEKDETEKDLN